ncbi:hypothetical protein BaRGS_00013361 [Batillaria attramentaria]|uniref:Uncharacterized protein n=1 Tax=Batillaria attramentaria TaxID=370345 RepID=A0ABD0L7G4_9CAEN
MRATSACVDRSGPVHRVLLLTRGDHFDSVSGMTRGRMDPAVLQFSTVPGTLHGVNHSESNPDFLQTKFALWQQKCLGDEHKLYQIQRHSFIQNGCEKIPDPRELSNLLKKQSAPTPTIPTTITAKLLLQIHRLSFVKDDHVMTPRSSTVLGFLSPSRLNLSPATTTLSTPVYRGLPGADRYCPAPRGKYTQ